MSGRSVQPVTLGRVVEAVQLAKRSGGSVVSEDLVKSLGVKARRSVEILRMTHSFGYLEQRGRAYMISERGERFITLLEARDLGSIHRQMLEIAPYRELYEALEESHRPMTQSDLLASLARSGAVSFNAANLDVLCDWLERLEVLQRNVFDGRMYTVREPPSDIEVEVLEAYRLLNKTDSPLVAKTYIEIPRLREAVCEELRIRRVDFDRLFLGIVWRNLGIVELSGAPLDTRAKRAANHVKNLRLVEDGKLLRPRLSSERELEGVVVNGRTFYYVAFHGGRLNA